jgi:hypothetical protein
MKNIIKPVTSLVIISVLVFFNITFNFSALIHCTEQNTNFVQLGASEVWAVTSYQYDKYNCTPYYTIDNGTFIGYEYDNDRSAYTSYTLDSNTGYFSGAGEYVDYLSFGSNYFRPSYTVLDLYFPSLSNILHFRYTSVLTYKQGTYVSSIQAQDGTYPDNGRHTDGYWYVKKSRPILSAISPISDSVYNASFIPTISVSDADGDILTCKYFLDLKSIPEDSKQISNTATAQNVSFKILDISTLSGGSHTITFEVGSGLETPATQTVTFTIDKTPPEINPVTCTSTDKNITVSGSVKAGTTDLHDLPYRYTVNGRPGLWTTDISYTAGPLTPNTKYTIKFEARDKFENTTIDQRDIYTKAEKPLLALTGSTETTLGLKISDGNPPGTEYRIMAGSQYVDASGTLKDTVQWMALTNKNINISGLQQNTGYAISVTTRNAQGTLADTAQISGTTLAKAPGISFPEVKQTSIKLAWNTIAGATAYEVEADGVSKGMITGTEYVHSGLTPETSHSYRIRVTNAGGEGVWGSSFNMTTLPYAPVVPINISAVETQTNITLTWDKVAKATSYDIEIDGGTVPVNVGNVLTYVHKGLTPDTGHKYRIRAKNAGGVSGWSEYISRVTLPVQPPTPSGITINKTNTSVTVSWPPVERAESYRIEVDGQIIDNKAQTSYKHEGLHSLSSHKYRIKALNRGGSSEWSEYILAITNPDKPETPTNIIATSDETSINLTWYRVRYAESYEIEIDGSSAKSTTEAAFALNGLKPDSSHTFKIKAFNVTGESEWSKPVTISTFPEAAGGTTEGGISLTNVIAVVTNNNITLSWDDVAHDGAYEIEVDGKLSDNGKSTAYNHTGLTAETYHTYKIRLKNSDADSNETNEWCAVLTLSTLPDIPDAPKSLSAAASNNSIEIRWDRVEGAAGYEVETDGTAVVAAVQEGYIHQPLDPGTSHTYRVRARNITGVTAWSEAVSQSTTNPTYKVGCVKGEELSLSLTVSDVQDFTGFKVVVTYNSDELELADLYGFTPKRDVMPEGTIPGTNLKVKYEPGRMEFTIDESITPGTMWSGEITDIIFMPKINGDTQINFTQE